MLDHSTMSLKVLLSTAGEKIFYELDSLHMSNQQYQNSLKWLEPVVC